MKPALEIHTSRRSPKSREPSAISLDLRLEGLLSGGQVSNDSLAEIPAGAAEQPHASPSQAGPAAEAAPSKSVGQIGSRTKLEPSGGSAKSSPLRPSLLRQGSSSASSSEELIGALHSPTHQVPSPTPRQPVKSPLPAPPTHLKVQPSAESLNQQAIWTSSTFPL